MSCLILTPEIKELAKQFPDETEQSILNLVGLWQEKNNKSLEDIPSYDELNDFIKEIRKVILPETREQTITYTPKGKKTQTYTIKGSHIYNKDGKEVFTKNSVDRNKIYANFAVKSGRAVVIEHNGNEYVVNIKDQIMSVRTGKVLNLGEESKDRNDILKKAHDKFYNRNKFKVDANSDLKFKNKTDEDITEEYEFKSKFDKENSINFGSSQILPLSDENFEDNFNVIEENKRLSNIAVKEGNAVVVNYENNNYVVFKDGTIISVPYGEKILVSEDTETKIKAIKNLADGKFRDKATTDRYIRLYSEFSPNIRRDRVSLISRLFSNEVDEVLEEYKKGLRERINSLGYEEESLIKEDINKNRNLYNELRRTSEETVKSELREELSAIDRIDAINKYTPGGIFNRVLNIFKGYVNDTEENRVQAELFKINSIPGADRYSDEQKLRTATNRAKYKTEQYQKIIDNFRELSEEAAKELSVTEKIRINPEYRQTSEMDPTYEMLDTENTFDVEEAVKEGWMFSFREVSSKDRMSKEVRNIIRNIPRYNKKGRLDRDDLGNVRYLDADYVHAVLVGKLKNMITSDDLIPLLQELSVSKSWVSGIIDLLQNDNVLFTKFYYDFRNDFTSYWVQNKKALPNGGFKIETIPINETESVYYLLNSWRTNYESGSRLSDHSVYNVDRSINKNNAQLGASLVDSLSDRFHKTDSQHRMELLEDDSVMETMVNLLNMVGIDVDPVLLKTSLSTTSKYGSRSIPESLVLNLLSSLDVIFTKLSESSEKESKDIDLINKFKGAYTNIADIISEVDEDAVESSVIQSIDGRSKQFYSYTVPNYIGKTIKQLKVPDRKRFIRYVEEEFKKYQWFYKDGEWKCDFIKQLVESEEVRKGIAHKILLGYDRKSYTKWDEIDYTVALISEYFSDVDTASNVKWAWYYVPVPADSPSAEFIRFRKYTNGMSYDSEGNPMSYDDIILDKLVDLVSQEYDRINLVIARDRLIQEGTVLPIANYDIKRNKNGEIESMGGAEFKFIPMLNVIRYDEGKTFLDKIDEVNKSGSGTDLKALIRNAVRYCMEEGFDAEYRKWYDMGLFTPLENTELYKYLPGNIFGKNQNSYNKNMISALERAKAMMGESWTNKMEALVSTFRDNRPIGSSIFNMVIDNIKQELNQLALNNEELRNEIERIVRDLSVNNLTKDLLREYYWNNVFVESQIIELLTTDLAFYKNLDDFQKRFKEYHTPSKRLNTKATFNGEQVGKEFERVLYLKDQEIASDYLSYIVPLVMDKYYKKEASEYDTALILSKFGYTNHVIKKPNGKETKYVKVGNTLVQTSYINVADGQAFRSFKSYREIMIMSGSWTNDMERAYNNIRSNTWDVRDLNVIWPVIKPVLYTQIGVQSGVQGYSDIKMPVYHKNSESPLFAIYSILGGPSSRSPKLRAIHEFMEEHNIDMVQFESAVKVGKQGVIDINDVNTEKDVKERLSKAIYINSNTENPDVVHKISYEDYGIQTSPSEHGLDSSSIFGTQLRKIIPADMPDSPDFRLEVEGNSMTKKEWINLYNSIIVENLLQSYSGIMEIFNNPKLLEKELLNEIRGSSRYGMETERACTLGEDGKFYNPLFDSVDSNRLQSMLLSMIRNNITRQEIKGGSMVLVSNYGIALNDNLHIIFKDKEGNLLSRESFFKSHKGASDEDYSAFINKALENKDVSVAYFECYMPAYSNQFYEAYLKPGSYEIDISKVPEKLRKAIGYRTPTEDLYSIVPLYIKEFLPPQIGSVIILPSEITTLSGSDFDIDKLYMMMYESQIREHFDKRRFLKDFRNSLNYEVDHNDLLIAYDEIVNGEIQFSENTIEMNMFDFLTENKNRYTEKRVYPVEYDFTKDPKDNNLKARNNLMISMIWSVLTHHDSFSRMFNPSNFDYLKKTVKVISILKNSPGIHIREVEKILNADSDTIENMYVNRVNTLNPLSPYTQVYLQQRNINGSNLIGVYVNHKSNHSLTQFTDLALSDNGAFILNDNSSLSKDMNGVPTYSLHDIKNARNEYISKNCSMFMAASVDNAKDPVLTDLNQNTFTADTTMLLTRLGYNPLEIGILFNQPIVIDITKAYFRSRREGMSTEEVVESVIRDYKKRAGIEGIITYDDIKENKFLLKDLAYYITQGAVMDNFAFPDLSYATEFYTNQVNVGLLFGKILKASEALGNLVRIMKPDTLKGSAGSSIAETLIRVIRVSDFTRDSLKKDFPLTGADIIKADITGEKKSIDNLRKAFMQSSVPFMQAFFTLGMELTSDMLGNYFPYYAPSFQYVVESIRSFTKSGKLDAKTINSIYSDFLTYIISGIKFFNGTSVRSTDSKVTSEDPAEQKWFEFITKFPSHFEKVVSENPDIAELEFIQRFNNIKAHKNVPVDILTFKNIGKLSTALKEKFINGWASLLYMDNPEAHNLAFNLFTYGFYKNGFAFSSSSFLHLAPLMLRRAIPGYTDTLNSLINSEDSGEAFSDFIIQYVLNHLNNRKIVPEVPDNISFGLIDNEGKVKDELHFTINNNSSDSDKKIIKTIITLNDGSVKYEFLDFIAIRSNDAYVYYGLTGDDGSYAVYNRIYPLGIDNKIVKYIYDKNAYAIKPLMESLTSVENESSEESDMKLESEDHKVPKIQEAKKENEFSQAYKEVYGESAPSDISEQKDISSIEANTSFKDENNNPICGI